MESPDQRWVQVQDCCSSPAVRTTVLRSGRALDRYLDLTAGEHLEEPVKRAVALGARPADPQPDPRWQVLLDPAGHPFCITSLAPPPEFLAT